MNIVDIVIIVLVLLGAYSGYHKGLIYEALSLFGFLIAIVLAFMFKNNLSVILYQKLPFLNFDFILKGATVFNIIAYELVAFLIILLLVLFILSFVKLISRLLQKVLNYSKILSFPFKIGGFILGTVKTLLTVFIILFALTFFNINYIKQSKIADYIIHKTPILSDTISDSLDVLDEFYVLRDSYSEDKVDEFNYKALDLFMDKKIVTVDSVKVLKEKNKLKFKGVDELIERYDINDK